MYARALDAVEFKVCFESPTSEIGEPIAGHVRCLLDICQWAEVGRASMLPCLQTLQALVDKEESDVQQTQVPPVKKFTQVCKYCTATNSFILRDYLSICTACGYENESCQIQDHATHVPYVKLTCGGATTDAWRLDGMYQHLETCLDKMSKQLRHMKMEGLLTTAQEERGMHLATLYAMERNMQAKRKTTDIATACAIFTLLETWALALKPVKALEKGLWITKWIYSSS